MTDTEKPIRILLVDDHPVVRHGLRSLLSGHREMEVVGELENGNDVPPFLKSNEVDVILLDIQLKGQSGIDVARRVRHSDPSIKIIILTTFDDESYLHQALEAGVDGFLLKSVSHEILPECIQAVLDGQKLLSPDLITTVVSNYRKLAQQQAREEASLSPRDLNLLAAIADGASNKDLAEQFYWSEATVKRKVQAILTKLGAANRTQAIAEAIRRGWI